MSGVEDPVHRTAPGHDRRPGAESTGVGAQEQAVDPVATVVAQAWLAASVLCVGLLALTEHFREIPAVLVALVSSWLILRD